MISKLYIENFRSIRKAELPLGKITVLTGANNSGKSSVLYALMVLRDFVVNPSQSLEELFALPFINLGGFREVIFDGDLGGKTIRAGIEVVDKEPATQVDYFINLGESQSRLQIHSNQTFEFDAVLSVGLPYSANINRKFEAIKLSPEQGYMSFEWNGMEGSLWQQGSSVPAPSDVKRFGIIVNKPVEILGQSDFVPIVRGFTKPHHSAVPMTGNINSEEEVATLLRSIGDVFRPVNKYLTEIADRELFIPNVYGATGLIRLMSRNKITGQENSLVNEGSGTNQLVTILAKVFQPNRKFICIDEPEIHLHPSMVRKLASSFTEIADKHEKQFLISTHSEHFVQALMNQVAEGNIAPDDVKVYYLERQGSETTIEAQPINEKGQIAGGLSHFYESELTDLKSFLKLVD